MSTVKVAGVAVTDGAVVEGGVSSVEAEKAATPGVSAALIAALEARVDALTDAGNRMADAIKAQVEHGYPVSIIVAAARADWRALAESDVAS